MRDLDTRLAATTPLKVAPSEGVSSDRYGRWSAARERPGKSSGAPCGT